MTSLAVAVANDSRGPCSLYVVTDSRITWMSPDERWDAGRKTFISPTSPDIFGYCGDAYFAPTILGQALNLATLGVLDMQSISSEERHQVVLGLLRAAISQAVTVYIGDLSFFHGARDSEFMNARFRLWRSQYHHTSKTWSDEELPLAYGASYLAHLDGTGAAHIKRVEEGATNLAAAGTSRAAMHAFCQTLHSRADPFSGGPPQLVGLWRKGPARQFGFCWHGKPYIAGMAVPTTAEYSRVDWFNHLFERCDGRSGRRLKGAKGHRASLVANPR